jgi:uncharacterized membrane-anchored protein
MEISKKGQDFILNLNVYLMTTGKSDKEIKEFIKEAEAHLQDGEERGKSVEDIFGSSPEEYAKELAKEFSFDKKELTQILFLLLFMITNFTITRSFVSDVVSYSYLDILTTLSYYVIGFGGIIFIVRKTAFKSNKIQFITMWLFSMLVIVIQVYIGLMDIKIEPVIFLNKQFQLTIFVVALILALYIAFKSKTLVTLVPFAVINIKVLGNLFNVNISEDIKFMIFTTFTQLAIVALLVYIELKFILKDKEEV